MFLFRSLVIGRSDPFRSGPIDSSRNSCYTGPGLSADKHHLHVRRRPSLPSQSLTPMCCTYLPQSLSWLSLRHPRLAERWPDRRRHLRSDHRYPGTNFSLWVLPGIATIPAMLCLNSVGDGLLDASDPRGLPASNTQTGRRSPTGGDGLRAAPRAHRPIKSREEVHTSLRVAIGSRA
jgi:hypothetical protein